MTEAHGDAQVTGPARPVGQTNGEEASAQPEAAVPRGGPAGSGTSSRSGSGVFLGAGEPNTFEPEEAAPTAASDPD